MTKTSQICDRIFKIRWQAAVAGLAGGVMIAPATMMGQTAPESKTAPVYAILYNFTGGADGATPVANLIRDSAGNLYGTVP
jgi:hypothetical protein